MLYKYQAVDNSGAQVSGLVDTTSLESAMNAVQRRGLVIVSIKPAEEKKAGFLNKSFNFFEKVKTKDVVLLSKQLSTLFSAQVSALRIFRLLGSESENPALRAHLNEIANDLQGGASISMALSKHPKLFSNFYVNMVKAGEETGKLDETFLFLAENLERSYNLISKAKNAMIYPIFVVVTFIGVMVLMLTMVIPKLTAVLVESGQPIPIYTKVVMGMSDILVHYGIFVFFALVIGGFFFWRWSQTEEGMKKLSRLKITFPFSGKALC
jgi:type IV pilus assembly protein PilC